MEYQIGQVITIKNVAYEIVGMKQNAEDSVSLTKFNIWGLFILKRVRNAKNLMHVTVRADGVVSSRLNSANSVPLKYETRYLNDYSNATVFQA